MKKYFLLILIASVALSACRTDFEINAAWKDMTVVYGLMNQKDSVHYVKINKAYLGEDNALTMAQNPDSCSYGNNLEVRVEEWDVNGNQTNLWYLDTTTIYNKESGVFYNPKQVLYKFTGQLDTLDKDKEYRLFIKNKSNGKIISSKTKLIHKFSIDKPTAMQQVNLTAVNPIKVQWEPAVNGKLYQVVIRFTYREKNITTNDSVVKTLDWSLGSYTSENIDGTGSVMETSFSGQSFFKFLHDNIPVLPNVVRVATGYPLQFMFSVGADEFNTYIEVNQPSTSVVQEKPEYTNISNGIGIFSSRYQINRKLYINAVSMDSLYHGSLTKDLNFH
jgi:hypothetical protein